MEIFFPFIIYEEVFISFGFYPLLSTLYIGSFIKITISDAYNLTAIEFEQRLSLNLSQELPSSQNF